MAETIGDHALQPKKVVVDGTTTEMRSAEEMIALDEQAAAKSAISKHGGFGVLGFFRAKPPNAMGRQ